jgi:hypothetical protein
MDPSTSRFAPLATGEHTADGLPVAVFIPRVFKPIPSPA